MPIFLTRSKRRRLLFRTLVLTTLGFFFIGGVLVLSDALTLSPDRQGIQYETAAQAYHYYYADANDKKVALTFDDGPTRDDTRLIITTLKEFKVPGTFFFIGENVLEYPKQVQEVATAGYEIGNHTFTHSYSVHNSQKRLDFELQTNNFLLTRLTGTEPTLYRPPYLLTIGIDPAPNPYIAPDSPNLWALKLGYLPVGIDIDPRDWMATSSAQVFEDVKNAVTAASSTSHIVLLHDNPYSAKALPDIIAWLQQKGYTLVSMSDLLTPPTQTVFSRNLSLGDSDKNTGGEVSKLQWFLYTHNLFDAYELSGVFDQNTKDAVQEFQLSQHLLDPTDVDPKVAGVVGSSTRALLAKLATSTPTVIATTKPLIERAVERIELAYIFGVAWLWHDFALLFRFALVFVVLRIEVLLLLQAWGMWKKRRQKKAASAPATRGVTLLIPAYNEAENIRSTIKSVIKSTQQPRQVIVIDDGSKDDTAKIVREVISEHPEENLQLISIPNGGKAHALTIGAHAAIYEILAVLDADAVMTPTSIATMVAHFEDPRVGAVAGKVYTTSGKGFLNKFQTLEYLVGQNIDKVAFGAVGAVGVVPGPAGAWRRDLVLAAGGFPTDTLVEDQDMTLTILRAGYKIVYEPKGIAYTETPPDVNRFLKQRFRWVYGTVQCFWKHKRVFIERPLSPMSLLVMPNILFFGILLPLTYPIADTILIFAVAFNNWSALTIPILTFTIIDIVYAMWGVWQERHLRKLLWYVPLQRFVYRQLLYYTVIKSIVRAIEGTGSGWNKFQKSGETQRFYIESITTTNTTASN